MSFLFNSTEERERVFAARFAEALTSLRHPKILLTPHNPSKVEPEPAAKAVIDNILRHRTGLAPIGLVDRNRGY